MLTLLLLAIGQISGEVVAVKDGDTLVLLSEGRPVTVRLSRIDAPEKGQPYGTAAKERLAELVFKRHCTVTETSLDRYGRTVGQVYCDGVDVNCAMVADGLAWQFRRYDKSEYLERYQQSAKQLKRGLWAEPNPTEPWVWRRNRHQSARQ